MIERVIELFWAVVIWGLTIFTVTMLICICLLSSEGPVELDTTPNEIRIFDIPRNINHIKLRAYTKDEVSDANDLVYVGNGLYVWDDPAALLDYIDFW